MQNYAQRVVERVMPVWHSFEMENLALIREQRNLTQSDLAAMVGANQGTISKIESGVGNPTLVMINRIAKALGVPPSALFSRDDLENRALAALISMKDENLREAAVTVLESMARRD